MKLVMNSQNQSSSIFSDNISYWWSTNENRTDHWRCIQKSIFMYVYFPNYFLINSGTQVIYQTKAHMLRSKTKPTIHKSIKKPNLLTNFHIPIQNKINHQSNNATRVHETNYFLIIIKDQESNSNSFPKSNLRRFYYIKKSQRQALKSIAGQRDQHFYLLMLLWSKQ